MYVMMMYKISNVTDVSSNSVLLITSKYSGQEQNAIDNGVILAGKGQ